ncbi:D-alanyl-D-alanine carboxypeptidase/D-alanyl-D-alanine endopeptidase [Candidatus Amoebophilus asiaticus]|uniref:D-alanyl-D-alanine carboxypeptidase/D-alanyl-D-alanine endopeptidase n=1 Tax=Candidatus Amoebophilus asiaticus TaxID=281120 RepID=UPI00164F5BF8|nr:D-alanyl-D-alanine carboxypeptidase/D-alanyl-D-alanine-endopeptidase [Candidatus Amoebophilus asiaticus]
MFVSYSSKANNEQLKLSSIVEIQGITDESVLKNASVSLYAVNTATREVIHSINPHISLVPASSLKLFTTATALEILGEDFKFQTRLQYNGEVDKRGTLRGNLYILGEGDPTLGSKMFREYYYDPYFIETWINTIKAKGIKRINGAVIGDTKTLEDYTAPDTWVVEDLGNEYGAVYSELSIFDNKYEMLFMPRLIDETKLDIVQISPQIPEEVKIINRLQRVGDKYQFCIYGMPYKNTRIIKGAIPQDKLTLVVKASIPDPAYWAAYTLRNELEKNGIKVKKGPTTTRRKQELHLHKGNLEPEIRQVKRQQEGKYQKSKRNVKKDETPRVDLYTNYSPPLKDIVVITNRESNNLYAEHIINQIGLHIAGKEDTENGIKAAIDFWCAAGIDTTGIFLHDGSGLSRYNSITTKQLVDILCYMKNSKNFDAFYHSLPIAGETGTLKELFTKAPLKGNLKAKTGGMKRVLSYTGYCTTISGTEIAFSLIVNNYNGTPKELKQQIEKLLTALVNEALPLHYK